MEGTNKTTNNRIFRMICPMCQREDTVSSNITVYDQNRYIAADILLTCPHCGCEMYEADDLMVPILKELNAANIQTHSHCARLHNGEMSSDVIEKTFGDDTYYYGPFVSFRGLNMTQRGAFSGLEAKWYHVKAFDPNRVMIDIDSHSVDNTIITTVEIFVRKPERNELVYANAVLNSFLRRWLELLRNADELPTGDESHEKMRDVRIPNYGNDDPVWVGRNPFEGTVKIKEEQ